MTTEVELTAPMEPLESDPAPPIPVSPSHAMGLRITVDLSESKDTDNAQEDAIINRIHSTEPEEPLAEENEDSKKNVSFVDNTGLFTKPKRITKNLIVTHDRKYVNRNAREQFMIGIDRSSEEWKQKVANRGKRFGTDPSDMPEDNASFAEEDFDISVLYESVGLTPEVLTNESETLRLSAINIRGLDDMSSEDVLKHFARYNPTHLEWIDDTSCNVVWKDEAFAAHALNSLSQAHEEEGVAVEAGEVTAQPEEMNQDNEVVKDVQDDSQADGMEVEEDKKSEETSEKVNPDESSEKVDDHYSEGEIEDDQGETDRKLEALGVGKLYADRVLNEDDDSNDGPSGPKRYKGIGEDDETAEKRNRLHNILKWRVGEWTGRRGARNRKLFMRFATIFDKKQAGANKLSRYYEKYGNPNFQNMPGLISNSMRRRMAGSARRQQLEEARAALKVLGGKHRDVDSAMDELAAMGSDPVDGDDTSEHSAWKGSKYPKRKNHWGSSSQSDDRPFSLHRTDGDGEELKAPQRRNSRGFSEGGRCPPPSPRNKYQINRSDDESLSEQESSGNSSDGGDESDPVKQLLSRVPAKGRGSSRSKLHADIEESKQRRKSGGGNPGRVSKMRSDFVEADRSRSRSRSPLRSFWVRPSRQSIHDRLGPAIGSGSSRRDHRSRHDRRDHQRRGDARSRLD